jgi:hypothetical protein
MKWMFAIPVLLFSLTAMSQKYDSWEIFHNRKEVASFNLKKETEDEKKVLLLNRALEEPGFFIITYTPAAEQADWTRNFVFCDSTGKDLRKFDNVGTQFKMLNDDIARLIGDRQKIKIYSWAIPSDPNLAASVRVRRILLCTIYTR